MGKTLQAKIKEFSEDRQAQILEESERLYAEYLTLQELRKAKKLTQMQLADILKVQQSTVAQMEKRSDLMLSTLRSYVEAMGGKLSLIVEFPGHTPVALEGIGDTEIRPSRGKREPSMDMV